METIIICEFINLVCLFVVELLFKCHEQVLELLGNNKNYMSKEFGIYDKRIINEQNEAIFKI